MAVVIGEVEMIPVEPAAPATGGPAPSPAPPREAMPPHELEDLLVRAAGRRARLRAH